MNRERLKTWGFDGDPGTDWRLCGNCRGHDPDMWLIADRSNHVHAQANEYAKALCTSCPVRARCEQYGRGLGPDGYGFIWGGVALTRREAAKRAPVPLPRRRCDCCGTMFQPAMRTQKFCTPRCRQSTEWQRHQAVARSRASKQRAGAT